MTEPQTASDVQYRKLSDIVQRYQPEDLLLILDHFEEGLTLGVQALPPGEKFDTRVMEGDGQVKKRQVPDELVMLTPEGAAWFDRKAQESHQIHLEQRGNIAVNAERLRSGQDDFAALFEARRRFITQKLKDEKKGKRAAASAAPTQKSGSKSSKGNPKKEEAPTPAGAADA